MPSETLKKALKEGLITQKQYDKLPEKLLEGIVKSKRGKSKPTKKPKRKRGKKKK
jgi:predicted RNA-binding protein associated with RNAse of E/G family